MKSTRVFVCAILNVKIIIQLYSHQDLLRFCLTLISAPTRDAVVKFQMSGNNQQ